MKKIIVSLLILIGFLFSTVNTYPADRQTKKYDFNDFSKVEAGNGMLLNISQSSSYSIEINAEQEDFKYLKVEKRGNTLEIYIDKNNYRKHGDIKVKINMSSLTGLGLSGGAQAKLSMDIKDNFEGDFSGGSKLSGNLSCTNINLEISGGSEIHLTGTGGNLTADASGGGIFHLKEFNVKDVNADLSGGSRLEIKMDGTLNVDASGGSRVIYYGSAKIGQTDFSGGSGISQGD